MPALASSTHSAYDFKLKLVARAAARGHAVLCTDCATLLLSDPFATLPTNSLLLSFQDKECEPGLSIPPSRCAGRLANRPNPDHASTIQFLAAGPRAANILNRAVTLLNDDVWLFGDQEAVREALREEDEGGSWGFLPYPAFVRSMAWIFPGGTAGYADADLYGSDEEEEQPLVGYAGPLTQRGLAPYDRVSIKRSYLRASGLWLLDDEEDDEKKKDRGAPQCNTSWSWRGFGPSSSSSSSGGGGASSGNTGFVSIAPATPNAKQLRELYTTAAVLLQQPQSKLPDAWWTAALSIRSYDSILHEHQQPQVADPKEEAAFGSDPSKAIDWLQVHRSMPAGELWAIAQRAQDAAPGESRRKDDAADVAAVRLAVRNAARNALERLHNLALRGHAACVAQELQQQASCELPVDGRTLREELHAMREVLSQLGDWPPPNAEALEKTAKWLDEERVQVEVAPRGAVTPD